MKVLILPGNIASNNQWLEEIKVKIALEGFAIETIAYNHWKQENKDIDIKCEVGKIARFVEQNKDFIVIAKSIGVILTLIAHQQIAFNPKAAVYLGAPVRENQVTEFLKLFDPTDFPVLFIQQKLDPIVHQAQLEQFLKSAKRTSFKIAPIEGNDHNYDDFKAINPIIHQWMKEIGDLS